MGQKQHHHTHSSYEEWLSWRRVSQALLFSFLLFWTRYEYHILQKCANDDTYEHSKNLVVLSSWACGKGEHYFSHLFSCNAVQKAVDPVVRKLERTSCWYDNHVLFGSWWTALLGLAVGLYILKLALAYSLNLHKQTVKTKVRTKEKERFRQFEYVMQRIEQPPSPPSYQPVRHHRSRSPRSYNSNDPNMPHIEPIYD